jgi:hypothetical protein
VIVEPHRGGSDPLGAVQREEEEKKKMKKNNKNKNKKKQYKGIQS